MAKQRKGQGLGARFTDPDADMELFSPRHTPDRETDARARGPRSASEAWLDPAWPSRSLTGGPPACAE